MLSFTSTDNGVVIQDTDYYHIEKGKARFTRINSEYIWINTDTRYSIKVSINNIDNIDGDAPGLTVEDVIDQLSEVFPNAGTSDGGLSEADVLALIRENAQAKTGNYVVLCNQFTGNGSTTQFQLSGTIIDDVFSSGVVWSASKVQNTGRMNVTKTNGNSLYDTLLPLVRNRISVSSCTSGGLVTLSHAPRNAERFYIYYWYKLADGETMDVYMPDDVVSSMENDGTVTSVAAKTGDVTLAISDITSLQSSLNAKQNIALKNLTVATMTNSLTETVLGSILIPANTVTAGNIVNVNVRFTKTGTNQGWNTNIKLNTVNNLTGSPVTIATLSPASSASVLFMQAERDLYVYSGSTKFTNASVNTGVDEFINVTSAQSSQVINWTVDQYLLLTARQMTSANADVLTFEGAYIVIR